ncbi:MAG TPA: ABC transporter ATP-binding protein [Marmoricola sp.]|jgi:ABC-type branched-subunit amino acid transport system ATPase component|nr:ABC transporter ATP-binding protein [Marmoricola sp.]
MSALLVARGVSMAFAGNQALDAVDLMIDEGEWRGLIGPNGSGKSTMLNVLSGLYRPQGGAVDLDGSSIERRRPRARYGLGVRRTFQHPQLAASLTLSENVATGLRRGHGLTSAELGRRVDRCLELFGCSAFADRLPRHAPYGAQKSAEVARALVGRPKLLLLDEPAAGLSASERRELVEALRECRREDPAMAVCLIEHDIGLVASLCDSLSVLSAGQLIAEGQVQAVLADERVREAYLGTSASQEAGS